MKEIYYTPEEVLKDDSKIILRAIRRIRTDGYIYDGDKGDRKETKKLISDLYAIRKRYIRFGLREVLK